MIQPSSTVPNVVQFSCSLSYIPRLFKQINKWIKINDKINIKKVTFCETRFKWWVWFPSSLTVECFVSPVKDWFYKIFVGSKQDIVTREEAKHNGTKTNYCCTWCGYWTCDTYLSNITKVFPNIIELWSEHDFIT